MEKVSWRQVVNMVLSILFILAVAATVGGLIVGACVHIIGNPGTVALDDWGHGIAICGEEEVPTVVSEDDFTMVARDTYLVLVNTGHEGDPEVQQLMLKAKAYCDERAGL